MANGIESRVVHVYPLGRALAASDTYLCTQSNSPPDEGGVGRLMSAERSLTWIWTAVAVSLPSWNAVLITGESLR